MIGLLAKVQSTLLLKKKKVEKGLNMFNIKDKKFCK